MHCEKNLCENIFKKKIGIKDSMVLREDLKECGI
jgi:hypothetical protein